MLTIAGPIFDLKDWTHYSTINAQFIQLEKIVKASTVAPRTRCLLKDVLDMRSKGWRVIADRREQPCSCECAVDDKNLRHPY